MRNDKEITEKLKNSDNYFDKNIEKAEGIIDYNLSLTENYNNIHSKVVSNIPSHRLKEHYVLQIINTLSYRDQKQQLEEIYESLEKPLI